MYIGKHITYMQGQVDIPVKVEMILWEGKNMYGYNPTHMNQIPHINIADDKKFNGTNCIKNGWM